MLPTQLPLIVKKRCNWRPCIKKMYMVAGKQKLHITPTGLQGTAWDHWTSAETASRYRLIYKNFRWPKAEERYWKAARNPPGQLHWCLDYQHQRSPWKFSKGHWSLCHLSSPVLPSTDEDSFKEYGEVEVKIIANHFFPGHEDKMTKLLCQWSQVKFFLSGRKLQMQAGNQSSTFFMSFILKNKGILHPSEFEDLLFTAKVGLSLPSSNSWPERGSSVINITKTKVCNRLNSKMLNALMQVQAKHQTNNRTLSVIKWNQLCTNNGLN